MKASTITALALLAFLPLAGCIGFGSDEAMPGEGWTPTGRTIHLRMWVEDLVAHGVYPGFEANLWAFCAEAFDPADTVSQNAIEYWAPMDSDGVPMRDDGMGGRIANEASQGKCSVPGPTLRVGQGDRVIVVFENDHFHCHTIHWHGQHVPWDHDGAPGVSQDSTCMGESFTYDFIAKRAGTLWYHCHVDTQMHIMQGLFGAIIVEPQDRSLEPDADREYVLILSTLQRDIVEATPERRGNPHADHTHAPDECGASGARDCQNPPADLRMDTFMFNGRSYPYTAHHEGAPIPLDDGGLRMPGTLIFMKEDERIRLRLLNAGDTLETIHPHGHDMLVTHRDGHPLPPGARFWVDTLTIGPAERYDVILVANNPGPWMIHTHVATRETNDFQAPGGMHTMMVYEGYEHEMHQFRAELPGGQPYFPPVPIPADIRARHVEDLENGPDISFTWPSPAIERPCAVKSVTLAVRADSDTSVTQALNDLTVTISDGDGDTREVLSLGSQRANQWDYRTVFTDILPPGPLSVQVGGQAVQTTLTLDLHVEYHPTQSSLRAAATCSPGT